MLYTYAGREYVVDTDINFIMLSDCYHNGYNCCNCDYCEDCSEEMDFVLQQIPVEVEV